MQMEATQHSTISNPYKCAKSILWEAWDIPATIDINYCNYSSPQQNCPLPPMHTHTPSAPLPLLTLMEKTRAMMAQTTKGTPPQRIQKTRVQTEKLK